ncbi:MAG: GNAT family N-acetyltransferase [Phycisphaerae bacterium]|nr:GNAT family N-acetyltransferase [Phycisphaerae bacterium]
MATKSEPPNRNFKVRQMTRQEVDLLIDWAAEEGWNPGLHDAEAFYSADPEGFFAGELDGQMVGGSCGVVYDDSYAFLGLYLIKREHRRKGFGTQITHAVLSHVGLGRRNVGLDGVVAMQTKYEARMGAKVYCRNVRYQGLGRAGSPTDVVPLGDVSFDELLKYDTAVFPAARPTFLKHWIDQPEGAGYAVVRNGRLTGYGVIRACRAGFKIGPLFADNESTAETLFNALSAHAPEQPVVIDPFGANRAAIALAQRHGMTPVFETRRMYTKGSPDQAPQKIFGVTSFELG